MTMYCTFDPYRPLDPQTNTYFPMSWEMGLRAHSRDYVEFRWAQYKTIYPVPERERIVPEPDIMADYRTLIARLEARALRLAENPELIEDDVLPDDYTSIADEAMTQGLSMLSLDMPLPKDHEDEEDVSNQVREELAIHDAFDLPEDELESIIDENELRHGQTAPTLLPERAVITRIAFERSVYESSPATREGFDASGQPRVVRWRKCIHPDGHVQYHRMPVQYHNRIAIAQLALTTTTVTPSHEWFEDQDPYRDSLHEELYPERNQDVGHQRHCQCSLRDPRKPGAPRDVPSCPRWDRDGDDARFDFSHRWFEATYAPASQQLRRLAAPKATASA